VRRALVTGASSGVGAAVAEALGARGDEVWLVGRRADALERVAKRVDAAGGAAHPHVAELGDDAAITRVARTVTQTSGTLDTLVHCAGVIVAPQHVRALTAAAFDQQFAVNVRAAALLTSALLPLVIAAGGDVVFVSSSAAARGVPGSSAYAASKAALRSFADSLREEVAADDVRVLTVLLGRTATPMQEALHDAEGKAYDPDALVQPDDVASMIVAALALPRRAEVTEIAVRPARKPAQ